MLMFLPPDVFDLVVSFVGYRTAVEAMLLVSRSVHRSVSSGRNAWITFWEKEVLLGPLPWQFEDDDGADLGSVFFSIFRHRMAAVRGPIVQLLRAHPFNLRCDLAIPEKRAGEHADRDESAEVEAVVFTKDPDGASASYLSLPQMRAYQFADLMLFARRERIEVELDRRTFQAFCVDPTDSDDVAVNAKKFRAIGTYGYNDNVLTIICDLEGICSTSTGPMHIYGIDYWDDEYEAFQEADDAFLEKELVSCEEPTHIVFHGSVVDVLQSVVRLVTGTEA